MELPPIDLDELKKMLGDRDIIIAQLSQLVAQQEQKISILTPKSMEEPKA